MLAVHLLAFLHPLLLRSCTLEALPSCGSGQRQRCLDIGGPVGAALVVLLAGKRLENSKQMVSHVAPQSSLCHTAC